MKLDNEIDENTIFTVNGDFKMIELLSVREAYKNSIQANEERDKAIFEKVKKTILEAIKKGYMYCEVEMLPASIVERLEELGYTVDEVKVKYHGVDPYCLISWPIDDDDY